MSKPSPKSSSAAAASARLQRIILGVICFCAGASVMIIEISANRLLAPYFGNSIYTWTALIGVVLVAISVGGYYGGKLADVVGPKLLWWLLAGSAVLTLLIPPMGFVLGPTLTNAGLIAGPVFISLIMFTLPGILLGAVSPACVRFYVQTVGPDHVGAAAGVISMLGALGSFIGTFLSGFVLLSAFGVKSIFIGTAVVLLLLAALAFRLANGARKEATLMGVLALIGLGMAFMVDEKKDDTVIDQQSSFYHRIQVKEEMRGRQMARTLYLDSTLEGGIFVDSPGLPLEYQNYWRLVRLNDDLKVNRALFMGAGAFGMPAEVSQINHDVQVDVAEIDPAVVEIGRKHFKLDQYPRVHAHAVDARQFVQRTQEKYDLVFGDAYQGIRHIPAHLVTKEFFGEVESKLTDQGIFLMNVISSTEGPRSELLADILATLKTVFPHVEAFAVSGVDTDVPQNVIVMASRQSWKPWLEGKYFLPGTGEARMLGNRLKPHHLPGSGKVMTDNWNPVDAVIARQLRS